MDKRTVIDKIDLTGVGIVWSPDGPVFEMEGVIKESHEEEVEDGQSE